MAQESLSADRAGTVQIDGDGYIVRFSRHLPHDVETVWPLLVEPKRIEQWYVRTELEPQVGGRYVEYHDHVGLSMQGQVTVMEPLQEFAHSYWSGPGPSENDPTIYWILEPAQSGCTLRMESKMPSMDGAVQGLAGWHICIDILEAILAGSNADEHQPPRGQFVNGVFTEQHRGKGLWAGRPELEDQYAAWVEAQGLAQ